MRARRAESETERASCSARRSGRAPYIRCPRTRRGAPLAPSRYCECRSSPSLPSLSSANVVLACLVQDAVYIQGLAQPGRGMGENGRGLGKEEDPRMRQQQNPLASPTVRHCPSLHRALALSLRSSTGRLSLFLTASPRSLFVSRLRAAHSCYSSVYIDPTDSSVCLHASARTVLANSICFARTRRDIVSDMTTRYLQLLSRESNSFSVWLLHVCVLTVLPLRSSCFT